MLITDRISKGYDLWKRLLQLTQFSVMCHGSHAQSHLILLPRERMLLLKVFILPPPVARRNGQVNATGTRVPVVIAAKLVQDDGLVEALALRSEFDSYTALVGPCLYRHPPQHRHTSKLPLVLARTGPSRSRIDVEEIDVVSVHTRRAIHVPEVDLLAARVARRRARGKLHIVRSHLMMAMRAELKVIPRPGAHPVAQAPFELEAGQLFAVRLPLPVLGLQGAASAGEPLPGLDASLGGPG